MAIFRISTRRRFIMSPEALSFRSPTSHSECPSNLHFYDLNPKIESFRKEVLFGLNQPQKKISPKFFYDKRGSELFDQICEVAEYYPTRTETKILESCV